MSTFVGAAHADSVSTASLVVNAPAGLADNDYMLALCKFGNAVTINSPPSGWTSLALFDESAGAGTYYQLFGKLAASEGASYTFGLSGATRVGCTIAAYRGGFDTADVVDIVSSTGYNTNDTTLRAASVSATSAGSTAIFAGGLHQSSVATFTAPSGFSEDVDNGSIDSRFSRIFANIVLGGSGATGDIDATIDAASTTKHAFLVILNPSAGGGSTPIFATGCF